MIIFTSVEGRTKQGPRIHVPDTAGNMWGTKTLENCKCFLKYYIMYSKVIFYCVEVEYIYILYLYIYIVQKLHKKLLVSTLQVLIDQWSPSNSNLLKFTKFKCQLSLPVSCTSSPSVRERLQEANRVCSSIKEER